MKAESTDIEVGSRVISQRVSLLAWEKRVKRETSLADGMLARRKATRYSRSPGSCVNGSAQASVSSGVLWLQESPLWGYGVQYVQIDKSVGLLKDYGCAKRGGAGRA